MRPAEQQSGAREGGEDRLWPFVSTLENPDFRHTLQLKQNALERLVGDLQQRGA